MCATMTYDLEMECLDANFSSFVFCESDPSLFIRTNIL